LEPALRVMVALTGDFLERIRFLMESKADTL
jgi:hypothetical protein